jgi:hypothetical protein
MKRMAHTLLRFGLLAACLLLYASHAMADELKDDERVMLLPSIAREHSPAQWDISIEAWVYELEDRPGTTTLFARYLGLDLRAMNASERELFISRTQLFRVDSEGGKVLRIRFPAGDIHALPRTAGNGRSSAKLRISSSSTGDDAWQRFDALDRASRVVAQGRALRVPEHGLSVISDIDDTIKHSVVRDRKELLLNTFARPFAAAPGMAKRYQELINDNASVRFHYVSSSPIQLYPPLHGFLVEAGFPEGSMHLRETTSLRGFIQRGASRRHKQSVIAQLLKDFPQRKFVLIGDSGEADPEIYAEFARDHADQIVAIAIRDVTNESASAARYAQTFRNIPRERWQIFDDPNEWLFTSIATQP